MDESQQIEWFGAAVLLVLGWILGLLTTPISEFILLKRRLPKIKRHIWTELDDLRHRLASVVWSINANRGSTDHKLIKWHIHILEEYSGRDDVSTVLELSRKQLLLSPEQLAAVALANRTEKDITPLFPQLRTPFLDSCSNFIPHFNVDCQSALREVVRRIDLLNQTFDEVRVSHQQTFDSSLSDGDRESIGCNIQRGLDKIEQESQKCANAISEVKALLA